MTLFTLAAALFTILFTGFIQQITTKFSFVHSVHAPWKHTRVRARARAYVYISGKTVNNVNKTRIA